MIATPSITASTVGPPEEHITVVGHVMLVLDHDKE